ncbi:MAG: hypothetical protein ACRDZ2_01420, partial [Ilumatobacteraceae bacterium]
MTTDDDALRKLVRPLDPTRSEHPPAQGSDRYLTILELAMLTEPTPNTVDSSTPARRPASRRWRRLTGLVAATAAAAVLAVGAFVILQSTDAPTAQAAVAQAAAAMDDFTSLEAEITFSTPGQSN